MAGSSFGVLFRITTAGESHGPGNTVIIDGVPPHIPLASSDFKIDLERRKPGQSKITTQRKEEDTVDILSGVFEGVTTGAPVALFIRNQDPRSQDYSAIKDKYRPGHADYTFDAKYGIRDYRGGGRSSARETVSRVAAGVIAKKILSNYGIRVIGYVKQIGEIIAEIANPEQVTLKQVEATIVRCPDLKTADKMIALIEQVRKELNSVGGIAEIVATGVPPGLGEPVFDKLKADLGKALFSIPAVVGVEFGAGFSAARMRGKAHNDTFLVEKGTIRTKTNNHGGMLGGISSGMPVIIRCAVKPTSSLAVEQETVTKEGQPTKIVTKGRHDPCLLPRFVPVGEAMTAIVLVDHLLRQNAYQSKI
jgi:chorismate synthase